MQARTYLALGDGIAAAAEIERARQLSIPASETSHLMAHALLLQDEPDRALAELETVSPAHAAYAARRSGQAFARLGDDAEAAAEVHNASEAAPMGTDVRTHVRRRRRRARARPAAFHPGERDQPPDGACAAPSGRARSGAGRAGDRFAGPRRLCRADARPGFRQARRRGRGGG